MDVNIGGVVLVVAAIALYLAVFTRPSRPLSRTGLGVVIRELNPKLDAVLGPMLKADAIDRIWGFYGIEISTHSTVHETTDQVVAHIRKWHRNHPDTPKGPEE